MAIIGVVPFWPLARVPLGKGTDVYLFLVGMMLLSEVARQEGLFDWLAGQAVHHSGGSAGRLFAIIYAVRNLVTVFLSNDASSRGGDSGAWRRRRALPRPSLCPTC